MSYETLREMGTRTDYDLVANDAAINDHPGFNDAASTD
jgi:hypothetical protein